MASHIHEIRKSARSNVEKLPDITGVIITYAGEGELELEAMERYDAEQDVSTGASVTIGAYSGTVLEMTSEVRGGLKLDGVGPIWEVRTRLSIAGTTF